MKIALATAVATTALVLAGAPAATAAPAQVEHVTESGTFALCGFEIAFTRTGTFVRQVKPVRTIGEPRLVTVVDKVRTTYTAHGKTVTAQTDVRVRTVSATLLDGEDSTYEIVQLKTGTAFQYRDAQGRVLIRDTGMTKESYLLETFGDADPNNDIAIPGPPEIIEQHGVHPDFDFCRDIAPHLA